jgi:MerR family transcriptional regulator, mercuric resistance operon regulatory protein
MHMHIGELARNAAVNVQTIRFYERQGLLPRPVRSEAGYRCYEWSDLERVIFIKRNQDLGFTLAEIKELLDLHGLIAAKSSRPRRTSGEVQAIITIIRERLGTINTKIRLLHDMRRKLGSALQHLESANIATCPVAPSARETLQKIKKKSC